MPNVNLQNASAEAWELAVNTTAADAATDYKARPAEGGAAGGIISLRGRPFLALRAFQKNSGGQATIDVLLWANDRFKAFRACRLILDPGAQQITGAARDFLGSDNYYEVDMFRWSAGPARPMVRTYADEQGVCYIDAHEYQYASIRVQSISGASNRVQVYAKPAETVPPEVKIPFIGTLTKGSSGSWSAQAFRQLDDSTNLAAPGSGWQYVITDVLATLDVAAAISIVNSGGLTTFFPSHTIPAGAYSLPLGPQGLVIDENSVPCLTAGSHTGRITIQGERRAVWR